MTRPIPFRSVNRRGQPGYCRDMQRHHLLPRGLLSRRPREKMLELLDPRRLGIEDFRRNGLLLPCEEAEAQRTGLPLHRGPHPAYDAMVADRLGAIEAQWAQRRRRHPKLAALNARLRIALLQRNLRTQLLSQSPPPLNLQPNRPIGTNRDFSDLDAMAQRLWDGDQAAS